MSESLKYRVQQIKQLPTVPVIAQEILAIVKEEDVSLQKIESIIQNDPVISAKILSVSNSAFFGYSSRAKTLSNAITRIGFDNVTNIAVSISLMSVFEIEGSSKALDYQKIFNHSVSVGFVSKLLSKDLGLDPEEIMTAGLLHDIGLLVMNRYFLDDYKTVMDWIGRGRSLLNAEREVFDFRHTDVGAWLSDTWGLPPVVHDAALFHHMPSAARKNLKLMAVIHIADFFVTNHICGVSNNGPEYPFDPAVFDILGINEVELQAIEDNILSRLAIEKN